MVTGLLQALNPPSLDGMLSKSSTRDSDLQDLSFGAILKAREQQLQKEQSTSAASIAAALAAMQTTLAVHLQPPELSLNVAETRPAVQPAATSPARADLPWTPSTVTQTTTGPETVTLAKPPVANSVTSAAPAPKIFSQAGDETPKPVAHQLLTASPTTSTTDAQPQALPSEANNAVQESITSTTTIASTLTNLRANRVNAKVVAQQPAITAATKTDSPLPASKSVKVANTTHSPDPASAPKQSVQTAQNPPQTTKLSVNAVASDEKSAVESKKVDVHATGVTVITEGPESTTKISIDTVAPQQPAAQTEPLLHHEPVEKLPAEFIAAENQLKPVLAGKVNPESTVRVAQSDLKTELVADASSFVQPSRPDESVTKPTTIFPKTAVEFKPVEKQAGVIASAPEVSQIETQAAPKTKTPISDKTVRESVEIAPTPLKSEQIRTARKNSITGSAQANEFIDVSEPMLAPPSAPITVKAKSVEDKAWDTAPTVETSRITSDAHVHQPKSVSVIEVIPDTLVSIKAASATKDTALHFEEALIHAPDWSATNIVETPQPAPVKQSIRVAQQPAASAVEASELTTSKNSQPAEVPSSTNIDVNAMPVKKTEHAPTSFATDGVVQKKAETVPEQSVPAAQIPETRASQAQAVTEAVTEAVRPPIVVVQPGAKEDANPIQSVPRELSIESSRAANMQEAAPVKFDQMLESNRAATIDAAEAEAKLADPAQVVSQKFVPVTTALDSLPKMQPRVNTVETGQAILMDEKKQPEKKYQETERLPDRVVTTTHPVQESFVERVAGKGLTTPIQLQAADVIEQIAPQLKARIQVGPSSMRLQLNPKELGAIEVQIVSSPQGVSLTFSAEQPATGRLLETQMNQLRQSLADVGIQLAGMNIGQHGQPRQEGGFLNQNPQFAQTPQREASSREIVTTESLRPERVRGPAGEVDYLV